MTNKLTKNDSMPKKIDRFDVIVATFEAFLKTVNAHEFYYKEWARHYNYNGTANVFYAWRRWAEMNHPHLWIKDSFTWSGSCQGFLYWYKRNSEWISYIKEILKK